MDDGDFGLAAALLRGTTVFAAAACPDDFLGGDSLAAVAGDDFLGEEPFAAGGGGFFGGASLDFAFIDFFLFVVVVGTSFAIEAFFAGVFLDGGASFAAGDFLCGVSVPFDSAGASSRDFMEAALAAARADASVSYMNWTATEALSEAALLGGGVANSFSFFGVTLLGFFFAAAAAAAAPFFDLAGFLTAAFLLPFVVAFFSCSSSESVSVEEDSFFCFVFLAVFLFGSASFSSSEDDVSSWGSFSENVTASCQYFSREFNPRYVIKPRCKNCQAQFHTT